MFVVTQKPTFIAPVVANIPADNGRFDKIKFSVLFKALDKDAVHRLLERIRDRARAVQKAAEAERLGQSFDAVEPLLDREVLDDVLAGFGPDLVEEDRTPMAFTPANVDRLCAIYPLESALVKSFFDNYVSGPAKN